MEEVDITIIGAGVVGLAIAAKVSCGRETYVIEKNETFGQETSSHNSEVIHAGIYYPPDSLKARLCVEGNSTLYKICETQGIEYNKCGKIIVATDETEIVELERLFENGRGNGVPLKLLSGQDVGKLEPKVNALAAILSPSTGILDSHGLMRHFVAAAKANNTRIVYRAKVAGIEKLADKYKVTIEDPEGTFSFSTRLLINCAGLGSDQIAQLAGIDIIKAGYKLHYCKGQYFQVGKDLVSRLVYPLPSSKEGSLGIHITPRLGKGIRLGPSAHYVDEIDYRVDEEQKQEFYNSARKILTSIEYGDLEPEFSGIRPKLALEGEGFKDFVIRHEYARGLDGFINLVGIDSPGLTSSPAIARYVMDIINEIL